MNAAIILCTKNGERYIEDQLHSLSIQSFRNFDIYINDDGSEDNTVNIIKKFIKQRRMKNLFISEFVYGSHTKNFLTTLKNTNNSYNYYFFCDQDDIWDVDKVKISIQTLDNCKKDIPKLFCGRTYLMNRQGVVFGKSPLFLKTPSKRNAIIQSIAGGNTMCFNLKTKMLLDSIKSNDCVSHDWLTYQAVTFMGGKVIYSKIPLTKYRQHKNNLIGSNDAFLKKLARINKLLRSEMRDWNVSNIKSISQLNLSHENKEFISIFKNKIQNGNLLTRIKFVRKLGLYRQSFSQTFMLYIAAILKKL